MTDLERRIQRMKADDDHEHAMNEFIANRSRKPPSETCDGCDKKSTPLWHLQVEALGADVRIDQRLCGRCFKAKTAALAKPRRRK